MKEILGHLNQACVACSIIVFVWALISGRRNGRSPLRLDKILAKALAGSALPTGIVLLICAFQPELVKELTDLHIHLAAAGLALLYISFQGAFVE